MSISCLWYGQKKGPAWKCSPFKIQYPMKNQYEIINFMISSCCNNLINEFFLQKFITTSK